MSGGVEAEYDLNLIRDAIYGDILSESTERNGRFLLLIAALTLLVSIFQVDVKSTPWMPLDLTNRPEILITFLATVNTALWGNYFLRSLNDYLRAHEKWLSAKKFIEVENINQARKSAQSVDTQIDQEQEKDDGRFDDPWWEEFSQTYKDANKRIAALDERLLNRQIPIALRWARLLYFTGLPLLVGLIAFMHTWRDVLSFVESTLGT